MYEHNGELIVRDATGELVGVMIRVIEDGGYEVTQTGKHYDSRPHGATFTTVDQVIRQHQLEEGDTYPVVVVKPVVDNTNRVRSTTK